MVMMLVVYYNKAGRNVQEQVMQDFSFINLNFTKQTFRAV